MVVQMRRMIEGMGAISALPLLLIAHPLDISPVQFYNMLSLSIDDASGTFLTSFQS